MSNGDELCRKAHQKQLELEGVRVSSDLEISLDFSHNAAADSTNAIKIAACF